MPIYEYVCQKCNTHVAEFLPMTKMKKFVLCPRCGKPARKVMSKLGFVDGGVTPKFYK